MFHKYIMTPVNHIDFDLTPRVSPLGVVSGLDVAFDLDQ